MIVEYYLLYFEPNPVVWKMTFFNNTSTWKCKNKNSNLWFDFPDFITEEYIKNMISKYGVKL